MKSCFKNYIMRHPPWRLTFAAIILISIIRCQSSKEGAMPQGKDPYAAQRQAMVAQQIVARGVQDACVIAAMEKVPRHLFVPDNMQAHAYEDSPLPIGYNQTISQPYIVAYMTEQLSLKGTEKVLEVGTGSGYQAAVLAELAKEVYTIEILEPLSVRAREQIEKAGYSNVHFRIGDGYQGWPEAAPFDAIIITAAPDQIPEILISQLKVGGQMIVPVGEWHQELLLVTKNKTDYSVKKLLPVRFVPMVKSKPDE